MCLNANSIREKSGSSLVALTLVYILLQVGCSAATQRELELRRQEEMRHKLEEEKSKSLEKIVTKTKPEAANNKGIEEKSPEEPGQKAEEDKWKSWEMALTREKMEAVDEEVKRAEDEVKRAEDARLEKARQHEEEQKRKEEKEIAELNRRLEMGFGDWSKVCDLDDLLNLRHSHCINIDSSFERSSCEKKRKGKLKKGLVYRIDKPLSVITFEEKRNRFKVVILNLIWANAAIDPTECWRGCTGTWISRKPLKVTGKPTNFVGWAKRFIRKEIPHLEPYKVVYVSAKDIDKPKEFEKRLNVEVLVKAVDAHGVHISGWFNISVLQVKVVGLRMGIRPELEWGVAPVKYKGEVHACPVQK
jgi:hypothetical protein